MTENLEFLPGRQHRDPIPGFEGLHARERFDHIAGDFVVDPVHPADAAIPEILHTEPVAGTDYEAFTITVNPGAGQVTPLLQFDPQRRKVMICNPGAQAVLIGKRPQVTQGLGYTLAGGATTPELTTKRGIYAAVPTGVATAVTLSIWVERE